MPVEAHAAIKRHLAEQGIDLLTAQRDERSGETTISGETWHPVSVPGFEALGKLHVALPVHGRVAVEPTGKVQTIAMSKPTSTDEDEARTFVASLATHGAIEGIGSEPASRPTHRIETGADGQRRLVRTGFSAV